MRARALVCRVLLRAGRVAGGRVGWVSLSCLWYLRMGCKSVGEVQVGLGERKRVQTSNIKLPLTARSPLLAWLALRRKGGLRC